ncbi:MAG: transaldolase family protein [Anaerococcus sp.]|jgi:TalC/MipB family fructose-6-phosphate aldolase|nr:transaldolase family protein [Peptoniphilaceae bacterium]MDY3055080.1 transaldolase family protein [Anaerococcus sp.]
MYLDTANLKEIEKALKSGIIKGVTTNPTILLKEEKPREEQIKAIDDLCQSLVFAQVVGRDYDEFMEDFLKLYELRKELKGDLGVKVPVTMDGLRAISEIKEKYPDVKVLATAIYSADQGILASMAGADYLAPYVNRMENNNVDAMEAIEKMRIFIDDRGLGTQILAASFKNTNQIVNALISGAHTATISYELLVQMADKDVALKAIDVFYQDGLNLEK